MQFSVWINSSWLKRYWGKTAKIKFCEASRSCHANSSWKPHARIVQGKLSRLTGVLSKIQYKLTNPALRTLYFALAFSHMRYGIIFWSSAPNNEFNRIFSLQKRIIRIINGKNYIHPTENLFKNSNILKLKDVSNHEMGKFIHSDLNYGHHFNLSPRSNIHNHETRNRHQLSLPQPRSNILLNSFFYQGVQYYNNIPDIIKSSTSKKMFKNKLKYQILATYGNWRTTWVVAQPTFHTLGLRAWQSQAGLRNWLNHSITG